MKSRMPERARTDPREPQGSNPLWPPGPELPELPQASVGMVSQELRRYNQLATAGASVQGAAGRARGSATAQARLGRHQGAALDRTPEWH